MKKMKKNERNSYLRSFFGLEARPEGKFRGQVPYTEVLGPLGYRGGRKWPKKLKNCYKMDKNEQMWKELLNKLHFWAGPTVQGWIEGVSLIWQHSKNSRPQGGGQNGPKKSLKNELSWKKMKKSEKNSWLRYFLGLEARPESIFRGQVT